MTEALAADARVLVIVVARIGDTLLVTPALRALKAACPSGHLTVLAHPKRLAVLRHLDFIDELLPFTRLRQWLGARLGAPRHDVAVVYGRDPRTLRYASRAALRVTAFEQQVPGFVLSPAVPQPRGMHAVRERLMLVEALGVHAAGLRLAYTVTAAEAGWAREWLAARGADAGRLLIGLQMRSFPTKAHRDWPEENFVELARRLRGAHPSCVFVALGDRQSIPGAQVLAQALGLGVVNAAGRLALRQTAAVMAQLDLYVGVDTGPTHIAGALGIPMVALYHWAYPGRNLVPLEHPACIALEHPAAGSDAAQDESMAAIGVDPVYAAAERLLAGRKPGR